MDGSLSPGEPRGGLAPLSAHIAAGDIEALVQWAIGQTGRLLWRGVSPRELMLDGGYSVVPKGCDRRFHGGGTVLSRAIDDDAAMVVEAIKRLEPAVAAVVIACGREGRRPDWMAGVMPRRVPCWKRHRRKHRRMLAGYRWEPCSPEAIRAARDVYERWHAALRLLCDALQGTLTRWRITGFAAPARPWEHSPDKSA